MSYCRSLVVFSPPIPLLSVRYGRFLSAERILNVTLFNWGDVVKMSSMVAAFWRRLQCYSLLELNRRPVADDTFDLPRRKFPALCVLGKNERFSFFTTLTSRYFFGNVFFFSVQGRLAYRLTSAIEKYGGNRIRCVTFSCSARHLLIWMMESCIQTVSSQVLCNKSQGLFVDIVLLTAVVTPPRRLVVISTGNWFRRPCSFFFRFRSLSDDCCDEVVTSPRCFSLF